MRMPVAIIVALCLLFLFLTVPKTSEETISGTKPGSSLLSKEMVGTFQGQEPASYMKLGNQKIEVPGSSWRVEVSGNTLNMIQVSDGQTITYDGLFKVTKETEISVTIEGQLKDNKYQQVFTPTMIFNKGNKKWFLKGAAGSEGCDLEILH